MKKLMAVLMVCGLALGISGAASGGSTGYRWRYRATPEAGGTWNDIDSNWTTLANWYQDDLTTYAEELPAADDFLWLAGGFDPTDEILIGAGMDTDILWHRFDVRVIRMTGGTHDIWGSSGLNGAMNMTGGDFYQSGGDVYLHAGMLRLNTAGSVYQISDGTFTIASTHPIYADGLGTFEIVGTAPTINAGGFQFDNAGKLSFIMDASGVSPILVNGTGLYRAANITMSFDFTAMTAPVGDIPLIQYTGTNRTSLENWNNLGWGTYGEGDTVYDAGSWWYTISYAYEADGDGLANDVALIQHVAPVPEPAGLGLIGLALLAIRKKRN